MKKAFFKYSEMNRSLGIKTYNPNITRRMLQISIINIIIDSRIKV